MALSGMKLQVVRSKLKVMRCAVAEEHYQAWVRLLLKNQCDFVIHLNLFDGRKRESKT